MCTFCTEQYAFMKIDTRINKEKSQYNIKQKKYEQLFTIKAASNQLSTAILYGNFTVVHTISSMFSKGLQQNDHNYGKLTRCIISSVKEENILELSVHLHVYDSASYIYQNEKWCLTRGRGNTVSCFMKLIWAFFHASNFDKHVKLPLLFSSVRLMLSEINGAFMKFS